jgi:hypothetical protein
VHVHVPLEMGGGLVAFHADAVRQTHVLYDVEALLDHGVGITQLKQQIVALANVHRALTLAVHMTNLHCIIYR